MNSKKAKSIRATIYGDMANKKELRKDKNTGTLYADSLRQRYQIAKGRKTEMPRMMGGMRLVAKRPKVKSSRPFKITGAFGTVNRLASVQLNLKVIPRSKRARTT